MRDCLITFDETIKLYTKRDGMHLQNIVALMILFARPAYGTTTAMNTKELALHLRCGMYSTNSREVGSQQVENPS